MSLLSWLKNSPQPKTPGLPNPCESKTENEAETIVAANTSVDKLTSEENPKKRKRGEYQNYDETVRAKIAVYAIDNGVMKATRKCSTEMNKKLSESTVRSMKKAFLKEQTRTGATPCQLVKAQRGQRPKLGDEEEEVKLWIKKTRLAGGVINVRMVLAAADGILRKRHKSMLKEFGGG